MLYSAGALEIYAEKNVSLFNKSPIIDYLILEDFKNTKTNMAIRNTSNLAFFIVKIQGNIE